jgi:hypothetical protein
VCATGERDHAAGNSAPPSRWQTFDRFTRPFDDAVRAPSRSPRGCEGRDRLSAVRENLCDSRANAYDSADHACACEARACARVVFAHCGNENAYPHAIRTCACACRTSVSARYVHRSVVEAIDSDRCANRSTPIAYSTVTVAYRQAIAADGRIQCADAYVIAAESQDRYAPGFANIAHVRATHACRCAYRTALTVTSSYWSHMNSDDCDPIAYR